MKTDKTRRAFIKTSGATLAGGWLATNMSVVMAAARNAEQAQSEAAGFTHLDPVTARGLGALADQIFPPDDTPGAQAIGVVYFIDTAVGSFASGGHSSLVEGVQLLNQRAAETAGSDIDFAALEFDEQTAIVKEIESSGFFRSALNLTLMGLFALPSYGGNKDLIGWQLLGFEPRHAWQPPFGYYDANYEGESDHASS